MGPPMWTSRNRGRYDRSGLRYPSDLTDEEWALLGPPWIPERSATRLREADLNVLSKLGNQGLEWRLEP